MERSDPFNFSQPESAQKFSSKIRLIRISVSIAIVIATNIFQARSGKKISSKVCLKIFNQSLLKKIQAGSGSSVGFFTTESFFRILDLCKPI